MEKLHTNTSTLRYNTSTLLCCSDRKKCHKGGSWDQISHPMSFKYRSKTFLLAKEYFGPNINVKRMCFAKSDWYDLYVKLYKKNIVSSWRTECHLKTLSSLILSAERNVLSLSCLLSKWSNLWSHTANVAFSLNFIVYLCTV